MAEDIGRKTALPGPIQLERRNPLRLPDDEVLRKLCSQLWATVDRALCDKAHPIIGSVWLAIARRSAYSDYLGHDGTDAALFVLKLRRVHGELAELLSLVTPEPDRRRLGDEMLEWLIRQGVCNPAAQGIVKRWNQEKGRPTTRKELAVRALEMQILNPKLKWSEIADQLNYPKSCERPTSETLPAEVRHVKKILRRYGLWDNRRHSSQ